ncbi:hypothetical protein [Halobellus captivus]|uniref:hypothetical protein n=1 Tax=Halobellus captivus TaxID=2592614 RepID=UPI0011A38FEA|nr:hypothetical protein [Halobellus captivus]
MSAQTYRSHRADLTSSRTWGAAVAGGLLAGVAMGLLMDIMMGAMPLIGALYGQPTVIAGWTAHLFHSVVFALIFAAVIGSSSLREYGLFGIIGVGAVYGVILEIVAAGFVLPIWANAVGAGGGGLPVPFIALPGFVTHIVYGVILGAVFALAITRNRSKRTNLEGTEQSEM